MRPRRHRWTGATACLTAGGTALPGHGRREDQRPRLRLLPSPARRRAVVHGRHGQVGPAHRSEGPRGDVLARSAYNLMWPAQALVEATQSLLTVWHRAVVYEPVIVAVDGSFRLRMRADQSSDGRDWSTGSQPRAPTATPRPSSATTAKTSSVARLAGQTGANRSTGCS